MASQSWQDLAFSATDDTLLWELFHENSKLGRYALGLTEEEVQAYLATLSECLTFDGYPTTPLPSRLPDLRISLQRAIDDRISCRRFKKHAIPFNDLATLLLLGYGLSCVQPSPTPARRRRVVPSAGALYPLEIFFHATHVKDLPAGLYHFNPAHRLVECIRTNCKRSEVSRSFTQTSVVDRAAVIIFITAMFERSTFKYGDRGYRFSLIEAGHVAQNANLVASGLGLSSVNLGGFYERELDDFLSIDGITHSTIYAIAVGTPVNHL